MAERGFLLAQEDGGDRVGSCWARRDTRDKRGYDGSFGWWSWRYA